MHSKPAPKAAYLPLLAALALAAATLQISACKTSCSQDSVPPSQIDTSDNPYRLAYLTTNFDIRAVTWDNRTTGQSGHASLTRVYECVFLFGCGNWLRVEMEISLAPGLNNIRVKEDEGDCKFSDDYQITLN